MILRSSLFLLLLLPGGFAAEPTSPVSKEQSRTRYTRVHVNIPVQPFATVCSIATDVVHGRILDQWTVETPTGLVMREIAVEILDSSFGRVGSVEIVRVVGGETASNKTLVSCSPSFSLDEEVVLFLWRDESTGDLGILGLSQGTYRTQKATDESLHVVGLHSEGETISSFLHRVRQAVRAVESGRSPR